MILASVLCGAGLVAVLLIWAMLILSGRLSRAEELREMKRQRLDDYVG